MSRKRIETNIDQLENGHFQVDLYLTNPKYRKQRTHSENFYQPSDRPIFSEAKEGTKQSGIVAIRTRQSCDSGTSH